MPLETGLPLWPLNCSWAGIPKVLVLPEHLKMDSTKLPGRFGEYLQHAQLASSSPTFSTPSLSKSEPANVATVRQDNRDNPSPLGPEVQHVLWQKPHHPHHSGCWAGPGTASGHHLCRGLGHMPERWTQRKAATQAHLDHSQVMGTQNPGEQCPRDPEGGVPGVCVLDRAERPVLPSWETEAQSSPHG